MGRLRHSPAALSEHSREIASRGAFDRRLASAVPAPNRHRFRWSARDYPISPVPRVYRPRLPLPRHAVSLARRGLSPRILPGTCKPGYECFKLNISLEHLTSWFYRGCWHQPCPRLSGHTIYMWQQRELLIPALRLAPSRLRALWSFLACCTS